MNAPTVTVCVITRNQPDLVPLAVRSVYAQTYRDFELVIVDDCSDDGVTPAVVARLVQERPRDLYVRCICRASIGGGPGPSRNNGFNTAARRAYSRAGRNISGAPSLAARSNARSPCCGPWATLAHSG